MIIVDLGFSKKKVDFGAIDPVKKTKLYQKHIFGALEVFRYEKKITSFASQLPRYRNQQNISGDIIMYMYLKTVVHIT
jgi:hypothetical protein